MKNEGNRKSNGESRQQPKILIVDDEFSVLVLVKEFISKCFDCETITANAVSEVLEMMDIDGRPDLNGSGPPFDIVVLDIVLPDGNGFDLCMTIKKAYPQVPVMLISGYPITEIEKKLVESKADDFLTKPFNFPEFKVRMKMMLDHYLQANKKIVLKKHKIQLNQRKIPMNSIPYVGELIDSYLITDPISFGKENCLFKVKQLSSGHHFVLKLLCKQSLDFKECLSRFEKEMDLAGRIQHPGFVRKCGQGMYNECPYYVMEYSSGIDLEAYLVTRGRPAYPMILRISRELASALGELHQHGFIHRDIKLKNIILCPTGDIKLIDFGIARTLENTSKVDDKSNLDIVWGTPIYMAPELFFAGHDGDILSEVYSLGASIYHLATGTPLFSADTVEELALMHRDDVPLPIRNFRDDVPESFDDLIVRQCLAKSPEDRLQSMQDFINELPDD